ncbi:unnamed protein product [Paramecium sonneborni]|uniref:Uncharacterized protein n=1 Tax=Paramecium sonneborni TaxID=65129 RepID=A0A8S1RS83_9CILI|nr:unnamed protein product [Paramecium sonneborni]
MSLDFKYRIKDFNIKRILKKLELLFKFRTQSVQLEIHHIIFIVSYQENKQSIQFVQNYSSNDEDQRFDFDQMIDIFILLFQEDVIFNYCSQILLDKKIFEENFSYFYSVFCNNFVSPSIQMVAGKNRFLIAVETLENDISINLCKTFVYILFQ